MSYEDTLPASIKRLLEVDNSDLGDYSEVLRNQIVLSRIAMRRVLEAAVLEDKYSGEIVETDDKSDVVLDDRLISKRLEVADKVNRTLADIKTKRLDAQDRFNKQAEDKPIPANIVFRRVETSPRHLIRWYIKLHRFDDAKIVAKDNNISWEEFEMYEESPYVEVEE